MILKAILVGLQSVIFSLFGWLNLPNLADYGLDINEARNTIMELLSMTASVIDMLLPWNIVRICLPIVIAVGNADKIYKFIMWIVRKIPMLGVK